ncbi:flavin reductase family protein [Priestia megaterium]|uniref:flavin reductase family protein n=1 Tax=Priestia megaterium TaxID=1404 RepID=UPI000BF98331|nr:flavin reductase family protein [Priestia megaterium]MED4759594.1 flavin reductase family protein [Priestia megaterium]PFL68574.1 flavin oxidoreductase [Priestia megaterium]
MRKPIDHLSLHAYPGMVALVTSKYKDTHNIMAAGWHTVIGYAPPIYGVSLRKETYSYDLIMKSGAFGINFVPANLAKLIQTVGTRSGRDIDKFAEYNIEYDNGMKLNVPILKEAYFAYECKVIETRTYGSHDFVTGEIHTIYQDEEKFLQKDSAENMLPDLTQLEIPLYLGRSLYATLNSDVEQKEYPLYLSK